MPAKPQFDKDGVVKRNANGKPAYVAILRWRNRDIGERFSAAVIDLIREAGHRLDGSEP